MPAPLPLLLPPLCHPLLPSACRRLFPFATARLLFRYCSHANSRAASSLAALTDAMRVPSRPSPSCQLIRGACGASSCAALHLLRVFLHLRTSVAHMYTFTRVHVVLPIIHSRSCYLHPVLRLHFCVVAFAWCVRVRVFWTTSYQPTQTGCVLFLTGNQKHRDQENSQRILVLYRFL